MEEFDEVYRLYAGDVYRYILGISRNETLAKDILQNTMLKAFTTADKFRGRMLCQDMALQYRKK